MIKNIAFTGYPTTDMKRARAFWEGILGLVPSDEFPVTEESVYLEYNIGSGTIALGCMESWKPSKDGPTIGLEVENIDEAIRKFKDNNVEFMMEKMDFPNCSMAIIQDPDGNLVTIHKKK